MFNQMQDVIMLFFVFIYQNPKNINPVIRAPGIVAEILPFFLREIAAESPTLLLLWLFSSTRNCFKQKGGAQIIYNFIIIHLCIYSEFSNRLLSLQHGFCLPD